MNQQRIIDLVEEKISGEWGTESLNGSGVKVLRTTNFTNEGRLRFDSVVEREIDSKIVAKKKLKFGDTIIEKSGGSPSQPVGRVVLFNIKSDEPFLCNNFTAILRPKKNVHPQYFFWSLYSKHLNDVTLRYQNKTTGILNLKLERYLEEEKVNVPDLKTQQKIAGILEQADAARQKRKQANQLTEQFLQSAFLEMFGDPVKNEKRWGMKNIRSVCEKFSDGPFGSNLKTEHYSDSGVRVIRLNNIGAGEFIDDDKSFITIEHYETLKKHTCLPGDILIGTMGDPNLRACILPKEIDLAVNKADCILCRPDKTKAVAEYFSYLLNNETFVNSVSNLVLGQTRGRISMGRLATVAIPIPPLPLQKKFASLVEQVEQLRVKQRESERELENLFQSLMQRYFG